MRRLRMVSYLLVVAGIVATLAGIVAGEPVVILGGLMLVIAGGVKVVVVYLWRAVAGLDDGPAGIRGEDAP
ncbi:MAG: hypothetical protein AVDCRST_MAG70-1421 [uncultured Thermomicrobiales bacterium]|uniref:Uncharacterized protein n=1 Tax=uncultured Thermomicrobiales bacterium TaxID=1645740 RepID=A0A6J4UQP8_9BACT|nr:MAG: hypothetical protein AVDCRST_MAG70-1421 [uncultured Thermomicrobiales bacterium]